MSDSRSRSNRPDATSLFDRWGLTLRRSEQATLFVIWVVCALLIVAYFYRLNALHGRLIDIDDLEYQTIEYKIAINQAEWPEFANVPGIGEKLARSIIVYRRDHGPFQSVDELQNINGIGPAKLDALRPFLLPISAAPQSSNPGSH